MTDILGSLIGIIIIGFLFSPVALIFYMFSKSKVDIDGDGHDDLPYRWEK